MSVLHLRLLTLLVGLAWGCHAGPSGRTSAGGSGTPTGAQRAPEPPPEARSYPEIEDVSDAVLHRDRWLVLDARARRVHVVRATPHATPSDRGPAGPGFPVAGRPRALVVHRDTIVVVQRLGGLIHRYDAAGTPLGTSELAVSGCRIPIADDVISTRAGVVVLATCPGRRLNTKAYAVLLDHAGESRVLAATAARPGPRARIDPHFIPVLATHPDGIVFGSASNRCLSVVDSLGRTVGTHCPVGLARREMSPPERVRLARLGLLARTLGARLTPVDTLPDYEALHPAGDGGYHYRVRTAAGAPGSTLVTGSRGPAPAPRLPAADRIFAEGERALMAWETDGGVFLATYELAPGPKRPAGR